MKNLIEGMTDEILRVTEIYNQYLECAKDCSSYAQKAAILLPAQMIKNCLDNARAVQASGDVLQMIPALKELQEITG